MTDTKPEDGGVDIHWQAKAVATAEPHFIAQIEQRPELHNAWWEQRAVEAREAGCTFIRKSYMQDRWMHVALIEGWKVQPDDQGDPRWQFVRGDS